MRSLSASELLAVWERGVGQHPVEQALTMLSIWTGEPREDLAALSIGQRDAKLFEIYEHLFGPELEAFAECPACGERLEYSLSTRDLKQPVGAPEEREALKLISGDLSLRLRLPNSMDLTAARECASVAEARRMLAEQCVVEAVQGDCAIPAQSIPDAAVDAISSHLAQADPLAEMLVGLKCLECQHAGQIALAIEQFLWTKIVWLAKRLLREVDVLARVYGWSEREILSLSAVRRERYLEMAAS
jgi:hypothetical protein